MLGWGASYVPSAWLVEDWPPLAAAGARLGVAGLLVLAVLAGLGRTLRPGVGPGALAFLALTQTVIFYGAVFFGISREGAGVPAVLANIDPLVVALLGVVLLGERLRALQWAGLVLGLSGATIVVWSGPLWPPELSWVGLVVAGGAAAWALGTITVARGVRGRADPLALAGWQMALGGAALALAGLALEEGGTPLGARQLGLVLALAVLGSAVPAALFYLALRDAPAAEVSAWFFLVPVVGVVSAWPALGEEPGPRLLAGLAAVASGLWLVLRPAPGAGARGETGPLLESRPPPVNSDTPARP
jgi:probable blue pigment (indigoidine) exporter